MTVESSGGPLSERERAELAAARERSFSQAALDSLPGLFYLFDQQGRFRRWNRNLERVSGYSAEEIARLTPLDFIAPPGRDATAAAIETTFATGEATVECDFLAKDGGTTPYFFTGRLLEFEGHPCLIGMGLDISERRRADKVRHDSEELLRAMIDQSPLSMALVALDGTIEYFNDRAVRTFGYLPADIPTMDHWWVLAYPDPAYRAEVVATWVGLLERAMAQDREIERREYRVTCKDGAEKTMVIFGVLVASKVFVMFEDITARKRAEEDALREREHNFSALADNASDGILIATGPGRHSYANQRAAQLTGYGVAALLTLDLPDLAHPEERSALATRLRARPAGLEASTPFETRIVTRAGATVHVEITTAVTSWSGRPADLVTIRDITGRKQAEATLREQELQLQQARRLESLGLLSGGVAHDFNNLLTPVLGHAELALRRAGADDPCRAHLEVIQKVAARGRELTEQLLAFGRKQVLELETTNLGAVVAAYRNTLRRLVRENVQLDFQLGDAPVWIEADTSRIGQILLNLAMNAQDAMPDGGLLQFVVGEVVIDEERGHVADGKAGPHAVLTVVDRGSGMDEQTLARAFEPFFSTKERGKGTGLGLATVHGIVRQHGGFIEVESTLGVGTTFRICIPRVEPDRPSAHAPPPEAQVARGAETLLVVEDDPEVREVTCTILESLGYAILEAEDGEAALRRYEEHGRPIDLLVSDVVMPRMGGPALYRRLVARQPTLRALFVSGYREGFGAQPDVGEPGAAFLPKPYRYDSLAAKVREVLDGARTPCTPPGTR